MEIGLPRFNRHLHQVKKEKKQQLVIPFYEKNTGRQIKQEKKLLVMETPFYEKYISNHEHQLEGLYFVDIERDKLLGGAFDGKEKNIPSIFKYSSTVSLVVPGISLTKALFSFRSAFSKVDLPALGLPTIAT